jgi:hypothetical protein
MRLFFTYLLFFLNSALGLSQEAEFYLKEHTFKFLKANEGEVLEHVFKVLNSGDAPLIIEDYAVACNCTKVIFSREPVLPGHSLDIKLIFDTEGKYYLQDRYVYLYTNTKKKKEKLRFKVFVIPREE